MDASRRGRASAAWAATLGSLLLVSTLALGAEPSPTPASDVASSPPAVATTPDGGASELAYVPVLRFWTTRRDVSLEGLRAAVEGRHPRFRRVLVAGPDPAPLWLALRVSPADSTQSGSHADVARAVESSRRVLGLVPAGEVTPRLRALRVEGLSLFGRDRVSDVAEWPLRVSGVGAAPFDPAATWTLIAGGDVMLDREVHRQSAILGKGADHPWSSGYAEITSRACCTAEGGDAIATRALGPRGALRELLSSGDITIVNHEGPAPDDPTYHPHGLVFTFDPALLQGLAEAGIDIVSLANNHIRNAGSPGVVQTIRNLRRAGIRGVGAGRDPEAARQATCSDVRDLRFCVLAYDAINTLVHAASRSRPGAAELVIRDVRADIRRLRREGADVIAVMPHWGVEYVTSVTAQQRRWARAMVRAGADVVLGAHSHVVGPIETIDGAPVLYSLGNLLFDLPRFEQTEEGVLAELTFQADRLAQIDLHPTVIVNRARVMLLDPAADGRVVLERMRRASNRLR